MKEHLLLLNMELIVHQGSEHFLLMSHMLLHGLAIDDNAIKIYDSDAIKEGASTLLVRVQNVADALVRPKGMTRNSYDL